MSFARSLVSFTLVVLGAGLVAARPSDSQRIWYLVTPSAEGRAAAQEPPLEELVQLNAESLFGGKLTLKDGRITLQYPGGGLFERGFACRGSRGLGIISDEAKVKSQAVRRVLLEKPKGKFSFVGLSSGSAVSSFELQDDFKVSFRLKIRNLSPTSRLTWFVNRDGRKYVQTNFFQDIVLAGRKRSRVRTKDTRFAGSPVRWFDVQSPGVAVELSFKEGKLSVALGVMEKGDGKRKGKGGGRGKGKGKEKPAEAKEKMVEVVSMDGIEDPVAGRLALLFSDLSFLVTDFQIQGNLPREWADAEIARLRKAKKLITRSPEELAKKEDRKAKGKTAKGGAAPGSAGKEGPDLDSPDPEADDEL